MSSSRPASRYFLLFLLCASGVLLLLFRNSLDSRFVIASNDGPLGAMNQRAVSMPGAFDGVWYDLNALGNSGGSYSPIPTSLLLWLLGPLGFSKFYVPLTLLFVGCSAWLFFRLAGLSPIACLLGGLAVLLNSGPFSTVCWGVGAQVVCLGLDFLALAALVSRPRRWPWLRFILAGLAVGMAVMEGADVGAIYSLCIAAFVFYSALAEEGSTVFNAGRGVGRVAVVAAFAGFMAAQSLTVLIGTQIKGVAGTAQDASTKAARWDGATQWSMPKREVLGLVVPGLFGYRMDTPMNLPESLQETYTGGNYWGGLGRHPAWDRYFEGGAQGQPPDPNALYIRHAGGGSYAGVPVVIIALWGVIQSFRRKDSAFSPAQRKLLWFWIGIAVIGLLLAFGRHAPFYQFIYALPYASTVRNPVKFIGWFNWAVTILFAYGVHGISRRFLGSAARGAAAGAQPNRGWKKIPAFDQRWIIGLLGVLVFSLAAWWIYSASRPSLERYLQTVLFNESSAHAIAAFSVRQVGWFVLFFAMSVGLMVVMIWGVFAGKAARWGGIVLGLILVADLARANLPWIIYWNRQQKYASNPIIDFLRDKPYEHRAAIMPFPFPPQASLLKSLYDYEWLQHHFQYYNVQSPDIVQMPRMPQDLMAFEAVTKSANVTRRWELTNTRYLLGPAVWPADQNQKTWLPFVDLLNQQVDPARHRFRVVTAFNLVPKPGIINATRLEEVTAEPSTNGMYALFEFTGALPRAKLYSHWQVGSTNDPVALQQWVATLKERLPQDFGNALAGLSAEDQATLKELASESFDPERTVLVASQPPPPAPPAAATNSPAGKVEYSSYAPKHIVLKATAEAPAILLLNDKYDPNWQVRVDGKPAELLRCNFIMRGVLLTPGAHTVDFSFHWPAGPLYVSLAAIAVGLLTLGFLLFGNKPLDAAESAGTKHSRKENSPG